MRLPETGPRHRLQRTDGIGEHHGMAVGRVLEEVEDALVFHQPLREVEVGLVVLDAVFARRVDALQPLLELRVGVPGEDLLDDLDRAEVLEYPAVGILAGEPEPRPDRRLVAAAGLLQRDQAEFRDQAVQGVALLDHDAERLAEQLRGVDVAILADHGDVEAEATADLVPAGQLEEGEDLRAERRAQDRAVSVSHSGPCLPLVDPCPRPGMCAETRCRRPSAPCRG